MKELRRHPWLSSSNPQGFGGWQPTRRISTRDVDLVISPNQKFRDRKGNKELKKNYTTSVSLFIKVELALTSKSIVLHWRLHKQWAPLQDEGREAIEGEGPCWKYKSKQGETESLPFNVTPIKEFKTSRSYSD